MSRTWNPCFVEHQLLVLGGGVAVLSLRGSRLEKVRRVTVTLVLKNALLQHRGRWGRPTRHPPLQKGW